MHMVIRAIVHARDEEEAMEKAKRVFEGLVKADRFDYYTTFDDTSSKMSGPARWGPLPPVARADSKEGKRLIEEGMTYTWEDFKYYIAKVRRLLREFSDRELFEEEPEEVKSIAMGLKSDEDLLSDLRLIDIYLKHAARVRGPTAWLYDGEGYPITNRRCLRIALEPREKGTRAYVVPADVHY